MSLPAGEAPQSHNILEVRTANGSDFEIIYLPEKESFQYPASVEGAARIVAATAQATRFSINPTQALLGLMNQCQEILSEPVSAETVVDYLHGLQVAYEAVQAKLIGSVRHASNLTDSRSIKGGGRPKRGETAEQAKQRREREMQNTTQSSSSEGKSA